MKLLILTKKIFFPAQTKALNDQQYPCIYIAEADLPTDISKWGGAEEPEAGNGTKISQCVVMKGRICILEFMISILRVRHSGVNSLCIPSSFCFVYHHISLY